MRTRNMKPPPAIDEKAGLGPGRRPGYVTMILSQRDADCMAGTGFRPDGALEHPITNERTTK